MSETTEIGHECPECGCDKMMACEYAYDQVCHYDGVSEYRCQDCGTRVGRWSGKILQKGEHEPPYGEGHWRKCPAYVAPKKTVLKTVTGRAPYVKGSATSKAAAESVEPTLSDTEHKVLGVFVERHFVGATDDEIEVELNMRHQTASARRRGLEEKGLVMKTDDTRLTRSGRKARVYLLTEAGVKAFAAKAGSKH